MLVELDSIEARRFRRVLKFFEVHSVELIRSVGVEVLVGKQKVALAGLFRFVLGISRVSHLGEEKSFLNQNRPPCRRSRRINSNRVKYRFSKLQGQFCFEAVSVD